LQSAGSNETVFVRTCVRAIFFGQFKAMRTPWYLSLLFLAEMTLILIPAMRLYKKECARVYQLFN
jgi:hypothetical protein